MFSFLQKKVTPNISFLGVDMHSHLLPGIDDGLQTPEQTVTFIKQMQQLGYKKFICTPHILQGVHNNNASTILQALEAAKAALVKENMQVDIEAAAEYMVDEGLMEIIHSNQPILHFGKEKYVLIEMSYVAASPVINEAIFQLNVKNYQPILAHPERYNYYHNNFAAYETFVDRGALLQVNLLSLSGYYGKQVQQTAEKLITKGMVSFIGTDMHHNNHLQATQAYLSTKHFYKLTENMEFLNASLL
jgi:protein-tyrosine phosphatase